MKHALILLCVAVGLIAAGEWNTALSAQEEPGDGLVQLVVNLLGDKDKDMRALGLEQVRTRPQGKRPLDNLPRNCRSCPPMFKPPCSAPWPTAETPPLDLPSSTSWRPARMSRCESRRFGPWVSWASQLT